ncbi:hypothetical protein ACO9S2_08835 [Nitrospira sp. NS4]|uniref:hypothetical protein n=1 Tax=Nitrospira sp. NS4 TaxID=3414498 RepID=UPI003C305D80
MRPPLHDSWKFRSLVLFLWVMVLIAGCTGLTVTSRVIQEESSWFIRLDSYAPGGVSSPGYDHSATWTEPELTAILGRMLLEDRVGLMDSPQPPRPVFSQEELTVLVPAVRDSFQRATPQEWLSFFTSGSSGTGLAVTSGGIFLADSLLHIVVANHRTVLAKGSDDLAAVRENPFHSVRGSGGALTFESPRFVLRRQANWSGGHRASASELVLDHHGFLSFLQRIGPVVTSSSNAEGIPAIPSSPSTSGIVSGPESTPETVILQLQE